MGTEIVIPAIKTARGLIFNPNGEILLCLRDTCDAWNFPGGTVESGEKPEQCVIREIKEETGLETKIISFVGIIYYTSNKKLEAFFLMEVTGGQIQKTAETRDWKYCSPENLPRYTLPSNTLILQCFLECPNWVHCRKISISNREWITENDLDLKK